MTDIATVPLTAWAIRGIGEVKAGDNLAKLILGALNFPVLEGDIFVVTSKIVSKAEGRSVEAKDREDAITAETVRVIASRVGPDGHITRIVENKIGIISAAAGVDASNTPEGTVLLLPEDPDKSALVIATQLREHLGVEVGVIISDTLGRPWRIGQTDCAIGAAGVLVIEDLRGKTDAEGRPLFVTAPCVGDEIASVGDLVKGKTSRLPVAVVRGRPDLVGPLTLPGARSIIRPEAEDLFSLGSKESFDKGYAAALREISKVNNLGNS